MEKSRKLLRPKKSDELKRISMGLPPRNTQKILIVSEGEVEKSYFIKINSLFRRNALEIKCVCSELGTDALSVVDSTITEKAKCLANGDDLKSAWSIFDVDKNSVAKIQQALQKARKNKINVCISNPCFEIWLISHDSDSTAQVENGDEAKSLVKKECISNYDSSKDFFKENPEIFEELMRKRTIAIQNSKKLDGFHNQEFPEEYDLKGFLVKYNLNRNPSTHVYKLINEIFEILEKETI